ncbi:MAG TPA: hypothetical protein VGS22_25305 [Thermoanaerobaculia bacterium]|jgi:hypothetical protein|nr:hypothetical protein [Thermoanaerobaculia bacterium]
MRFSKIRFRPIALAPLALLLLLAALLSPPLPAQTDPADVEIDIPYGPAPRQDPGVDGDPTPSVDLVVFGQPLIEGTLDPDIAVEELGLPEGIAPLGPSQTVTPTTCEGWTNPVTPLGIRASDGRYFTYAQQPVLMVGVSADAGCHLDLEDAKKCLYGSLPGDGAHVAQNYPRILADAKAKGLNKIRLWVVLGADPNDPSAWNTQAKKARNQPFKFIAEKGYYRLDIFNDDYFNRLREVVIAAKKQDLFVEVTLFAPFEGGPPSLWLAQSNIAKALKPPPSTMLESVGFTDSRWSAVKITGSHPADLRMRDFQKNVITWTVQWLWCYDNVYWEIANEPEQPDTDPLLAAKWQQEMIAYLRQAEDDYRPNAQFPGRPLKARHPVAVQPFTTTAANLWKTVPAATPPCSVASPDNCRPDVINGHYTQVKTNDKPGFPGTAGTHLDLGAISLVRGYRNLKKVLGMKEDNITPFFGEKGTRTFKTDIPSTTPDARQFGLPDPVRAEAWEFLLGGGGAFDHFGYIYDSDNGQKVRTQLGKIGAFLSTGFPVFSLAPSAPNVVPPSTFQGTAWVEVGAYPTDTSWDTATLSRKHWAAMESGGWQTADAGRKFLLYIHHSSPRCKLDNDDFARQPNNALRCAGTNLALDAYDGRRRPTSRYQEVDLRLHLGSKPGIFTVSWLDPTNPSGTPLTQETINWNPSPESCNGRTPCSITSPKYGYDIALRIVR